MLLMAVRIENKDILDHHARDLALHQSNLHLAGKAASDVLADGSCKFKRVKIQDCKEMMEDPDSP
jgi:hypothetical protein